MKLPENAENFTETVLTTTNRLIELGFWEVEHSRLESWWKQFWGVEEKFFAACLLDQIIFRSQSQFEAELRALFRSNLGGSIFGSEYDGYLAEILSDRSQDPKIRLVPVICESDPPTKSGPLVLRRLQRILRLNPNWMCWPWQTQKAAQEKGVNTIIFVDDFLGSGSQFKKFFDQWEFNSPVMKNTSFFYAPVVAHDSGIVNLSNDLPDLSIAYVEHLGSRQQFFSDETWDDLTQGQISALEAKNWYLDFAKKNGVGSSRSKPLGYGNLELVYGFSHATPNNSLPILWQSSDKWNPLLER